jgi:hypothetical protein
MLVFGYSVTVKTFFSFQCFLVAETFSKARWLRKTSLRGMAPLNCPIHPPFTHRKREGQAAGSPLRSCNGGGNRRDGPVDWLVVGAGWHRRRQGREFARSWRPLFGSFVALAGWEMVTCTAAMHTSEVLPLSLDVSISTVQNFAHNISIPMDKDKNKGVGGWVESWWIV